jgi:hypothetical protein
LTGCICKGATLDIGHNNSISTKRLPFDVERSGMSWPYITIVRQNAKGKTEAFCYTKWQWNLAWFVTWLMGAAFGYLAGPPILRAILCYW